MTEPHRRRTLASQTFRAVLAAAFVAYLFELATDYAFGAPNRLDYHLAMLVVSLGVAGGTAGIALGIRAGTTGALTLWSGVVSGFATSLGPCVAMTALTFLAARGAGARGLRPTRLGVLIGAGLAGALILGGLLERVVPQSWTPWLSTLGFTLFLAVGIPVAQRIPDSIRSRAILVPFALFLFGLLGLAQPWGRHDPPPTPVHRDPGPHVFLLVLDTVRADHLSIYGYPRDTTPRLARRLAEHPGAVAYPWAFSNGSWTAPSHASLLTGLLPSEHEVHLGTPAAESMDWSLPTRFELRAERTLAERFRSNGYATIAVFANLWLDRIEGMSRGFDIYTRVRGRTGLPLVGEALRSRFTPSWFLEQLTRTPSAPEVAAELLAAIDAAEGRKLFVLANFLDTHAPYRPPPTSRGRFAPWSPFEHPQHLAVDLPKVEIDRMEARYDEAIHGLDAALDALLDALDARGILENAWVFVTSDHGEAFGEHGVTDHGTGVYNEQVHVPLIVFPPRGERLVAGSGPVSLVSVAATAAAIAGAPLERDADLRYGSPADARVEFYADPSKAKSQGRLGEEPAQALIVGSEKFVRYRDRQQLFDLSNDPDEQRDLAPERAERAKSLSVALPAIDYRRAESAGGVDDPDLRKQLEALGYLEAE